MRGVEWCVGHTTCGDFCVYQARAPVRGADAQGDDTPTRRSKEANVVAQIRQNPPNRMIYSQPIPADISCGPPILCRMTAVSPSLHSLEAMSEPR